MNSSAEFGVVQKRHFLHALWSPITAGLLQDPLRGGRGGNHRRGGVQDAR